MYMDVHTVFWTAMAMLWSCFEDGAYKLVCTCTFFETCYYFCDCNIHLDSLVCVWYIPACYACYVTSFHEYADYMYVRATFI